MICASQPFSSVLSWALVLSTVFAQSCKWKNGEGATDYYSCDPTAAQSSCCLQGEACVGNGLCYGSLGVIYRGACSGGWGNDTACPQACNDQGHDGGWANLAQCPAISAPSGATSWWCGDTSVVAICDESGTNSHPTKAQIFSLPWNGMLPLSIMPWPSQKFTGCAVSLNSQYSLEKQIENATQSGNGSCNKTSTTSSSSSSSSSGGGNGSGNCPSAGSTTTAATIQPSCPKGAQIGEGVVIGVLALIATLMAVWAFYERRQKNRLLVGDMHKQELQQMQQPYEVEQASHRQQQQLYVEPSKRYTSPTPVYEVSNRPVPSEMDSSDGGNRTRAHEMQS